MTQHAVIYDYLSTASSRLAQGNPSEALHIAREGLKMEPQDPALWSVLLRSYLAKGDPGAAQRALAAREESPQGFDLLEVCVEVQLAAADLQAARSVVSRAEAEGAVTGADSARLKARIAMAEGDRVAARAILIMAVERFPDLPALRKQLTETLMASGGAGDARAVLGHIAKPPVNPPTPSDVRDSDSPSAIA